MLFPRDQLIANAGSRGLWIGIFPEFSEELDAARKLSMDANGGKDFFAEVTEGPMHLTLAHLGRSNTRGRAEAAIAALEAAAATTYGEQSVGVEGLMRLPNHLGFALVPDRILMMRNQVNHCLGDRGIRMDDKFAGIPHMTIGKLRHHPPICPRVQPFRLTFRGLTIVCADARVHAPFAEHPSF